MIQKMPASRVAKILTDEGIPSPDANRTRTDSGIKHQVSGRWHQNTVVGIARNPLLRAMVAYGRRAMGERRRLTPSGPRPVEDDDFRLDGKPKVRQVDREDQIVVPASFKPLIPSEQASKLDEILDQRAGTHRGKPRSRDPERNPLGGRLFDMACSWLMYRAAKGTEDYCYRCGLYEQSQGQACNHNTVSGPAAVKFGLEVIRQQFHAPDMRRRLREKLESRAQSRHELKSKEVELAQLNAALVEARARHQKVSRNMAFADTDAQREAMKKIFDEVGNEVRAMELRASDLAAKPTEVPEESKVEKALLVLDHLPDLIARADEQRKVSELFQIMDLKMFLSFTQVKKTKRTVNKLAGGVVTLGAANSPIQPYSGPTSRQAVEKALETVSEAPSSGEGDQSLGNVSRGDRTPIELFRAGVRTSVTPLLTLFGTRKG